jgi:D-aminoacyl-tRNA deacylase
LTLDFLGARSLIALLQRVIRASVVVDDESVGAIGPGLLAFVGVERDDGQAQADRLLERILNYRMFADAAGKMNLSLRDTVGGLLLVSQFTLAADTNSGNRPSFTPAASPADGEKWFDYLVGAARINHAIVETGCFGADMQVSLVNDGPVTFWLRVASREA